MKAEELFEAIGEIDDEIIESSEALYAASEQQPGGEDKIGSFNYVTPPVVPAAEASKDNGKPTRKPRGAKLLQYRRWYPAIAAVACLLVGFIGIMSVIQRKGASAEYSASSEAAYDMDNALMEEAAEEAAPAAAEWEEEIEEAAAEEAEAEEAVEMPAEDNEEAKEDGLAGGAAGADNPVGVVLTANNVTATGMDLVCTQSGGNVTGELETGTYYQVDKLKSQYAGTADVSALPADAWESLPYVNGEIGWEDEAFIIPENAQTVWNINWEWVYGKLAPGTYRISKQIMDFRGTGDYDTYTSYAYFEIN